jgi:hypothetical protein
MNRSRISMNRKRLTMNRSRISINISRIATNRSRFPWIDQGLPWIDQDGTKLLSRPGPTKGCRASQEGEEEEEEEETEIRGWKGGLDSYEGQRQAMGPLSKQWNKTSGSINGKLHDHWGISFPSQTLLHTRQQGIVRRWGGGVAGVEPSPLLLRPLLAYCTSPGWLWMMMSVEQLVEWVLAKGNRSTRWKPVPAPLCPPQISHDLIRAGTSSKALCKRNK